MFQKQSLRGGFHRGGDSVKRFWLQWFSLTLAILALIALVAINTYFKAQIAEINNKIAELETPPIIVETIEHVAHAAPKEVKEEKENLGTFKITAYCPCEKCCGKWADGITATGTKATEGRTIAVDPKIIPLGTKVIISGHEYIAEDTGGAIKGKRIDIYFESHTAALEWGVQNLEVMK